jgi:hypothetical protein
VEWVLYSSSNLLGRATSKEGLDIEEVHTTFCFTALDWHFENCVYNYLEYQAGVKPDDVDVEEECFDPYLLDCISGRRVPKWVKHAQKAFSPPS